MTEERALCMEEALQGWILAGPHGARIEEVDWHGWWAAGRGDRKPVL